MTDIYKKIDDDSRRKIDILLGEYSDNLNSWQQEFLSDLDVLDQELTARQLEKLDEIYSRCISRG